MAQQSKIAAFVKERRGSVAIIGALMGSVLVMAIALSLTVVQTNVTHDDMQRALDAALLSASRAQDKDFENPREHVLTYLNSYVAQGKIRARNFELTARYDHGYSRISGDLNFDVDAVLPLQVFSPNIMRRHVEAEVTLPRQERLEIAFALDMSASMWTTMPDGRTRMAGLQTAFGEMLDLIEARIKEQKEKEGSSSKVLISIAPYASSVNIGNLAGALGAPFSSSRVKELARNGRPYPTEVLPPYAPHGPEPHAFFESGPKNFWEGLLKYYDSVSTGTPAPVNAHQTRHWPVVTIRTPDGQDFTERMKQVGLFWRGAWALERTGGALGTDAPPEQDSRIVYADSVQYMSLFHWPSRTSALTAHTSNLTPALHVLPLTDNLQQVRAYTRHFTPNGSTAGHLGMEWAWYTLSPNWAGVWAVKPTNDKGVFRRVDSVIPHHQIKGVLDQIKFDPSIAEGVTVDALMSRLGAPKPPAGQDYVDSSLLPAQYDAEGARKVIVLMTDGQFSAPSDTETLGGSTRATYAHFQRTCEGAKKAGVTIYAIALSLDVRDQTPLQDCAGGSTNFFVVHDTNQLKETFRRIFVGSTATYVSR